MEGRRLAILPILIITGCLGAILDIRQPDQSLFQSFNYDYDGVSTILIVPREGTRIKSIKEEAETLWDDRKKTRCLCITLRLDEGEPKIAQISLVGSKKAAVNLFKVEGRWTSEPLFEGSAFEPTHGVKQQIFKRIRKSLPSSACTINLRDMEDDKITFITFTMSKIPVMMHIPKNGYYASSVVDGTRDVWKADEGERCASVTSYVRDKRPHLLHISIKNEASDEFVQFYKREGIEWICITSYEFKSRQAILLMNLAK